MNPQLLQVIEGLLNASNIKDKWKDMIKTRGWEGALAVTDHIFAEHAPVDVTGDLATLDKTWGQNGFENFKHFLRVGGGDYGVKDWPGIGWGADLIYMDGEARTAIHNLMNGAVNHRLIEMRVKAGIHDTTPAPADSVAAPAPEPAPATPAEAPAEPPVDPATPSEPPQDGNGV